METPQTTLRPQYVREPNNVLPGYIKLNLMAHDLPGSLV